MTMHTGRTCLSYGWTHPPFVWALLTDLFFMLMLMKSTKKIQNQVSVAERIWQDRQWGAGCQPWTSLAVKEALTHSHALVLFAPTLMERSLTLCVWT